MEAERAGRAKAADTSTTLKRRVDEEARRQPKEGRRRVARPEKKGVDGYTARSEEVGDWHARARGWMGTREERDWVRPFGRAGPGGFSGVQLHHRETAVGPGPLPPRNRPTNYAPIMSACGTEEGPSDLNHSFTEIEFYVRGFLPAERREDMC